MSLPALLRILGPEARAFLSARSSRATFTTGAALTEAGRPCEALWFVEKGIVDAQRPDPETGEWQPGPILRAGDLYGSHAAEEGATHSVRLTALTEVELFALPGSALREGLARFPELRRFQERVLRRPAVWRLLARLAARMPGGEGALFALADGLTAQVIAAGATVQRAGAPVAALCIVERGTLVARPAGPAPAPAGPGPGDDGPSPLRLGPGSLVGAQPLLLGLPSPLAVTADAAGEVALLALPAERIEPLFRETPALRRALGDLVVLDAAGARTGASLDIDRSFQPRPTSESRDLDYPASATQPEWWRRLPFVRQREEMDCGAACLRMLHGYHGQHLDERAARQLARVSRYGTSLFDISQAAERLGYLATAVQIDGWDALRQVDLPAIAHVGGDHFVVVWRVSRGRVHVGDPAHGNVSQPRDQFLSRFQGVLLLLHPTDAVGKPAPGEAQDALDAARETSDFSPRRLWPFARPYLGLLGHVLFASALLQLFGLVVPLMTQVIIDRVLVRAEAGLLTTVLFALVALALLQAATAASRAYLVIHGSLQIQRTLLQALFQRVLSFSHSFFARFTTGDLVRRFQEVDAVRTFFVDNAIAVAVDLATVLTYGAVLFLYEARLAAVYLGLLALNAILVFTLARPVRGHSYAFLQSMARADTLVIDSFKGIEPVKALALERPFGGWFAGLLAPALEHGRRAALYSVAAAVTAGTLDAVNTALLLWGGARLVLSGALTVGQLMALLMLARQLTGPFLRLLDMWRGFQSTAASLYRVGDLMAEVPERETQERKGAMVELPRLRGEVRFEEVSFRYGADPKDTTANALEGVTLHVAPGEVLGIVGRSGCGKSTLARLLLRFHDPGSGRIVVDGFDLRDLDPVSLRTQIGLVTQEAFLYRASLRENIACGRAVSDEEVVRAARAAGAYDFIGELPYGLETRVGEQGLQLSGGQKQRIVIARALCCDPRILIFDEATAALDPLIEREIHEGLRDALRGRTTIIIAHRLHVLRRADRIAVLDRGRLVEIGSHDELMARAGLYHRMFTAAPDWHAAESKERAAGS